MVELQLKTGRGKRKRLPDLLRESSCKDHRKAGEEELQEAGIKVQGRDVR